MQDIKNEVYTVMTALYGTIQILFGAGRDLSFTALSLHRTEPGQSWNGRAAV